jgi:hypothetical protein
MVVGHRQAAFNAVLYTNTTLNGIKGFELTALKVLLTKLRNKLNRTQISFFGHSIPIP